jgi:peptide/nickel transport system permease protein
MAIALVFWPLYARQVRGVVLSAKNRDFVQGARDAGPSGAASASPPIFPKLLCVLVIIAALQLGATILLEAFLSYLGIGIPRPTSDWGVMMADGRELIVANWWISSFPALAILVVALSLFSFGEWTHNKLASKIKVGSFN